MTTVTLVKSPVLWYFTSVMSTQEMLFKTTTAVFADISHFTSFAEKNSTETVQKLLSKVYRVSDKIANIHNGRFTEITGDEVSLHFDNPDDAIEAAMSLRQSLQNILHKHGLDIRIGIHTGEAVFWNVKIANILFPYVTGFVQVVVARLEQNASPGSIVISKKTIDMLNNSDLKKMQIKTIKAKGLTHPIKYIEI